MPSYNDLVTSVLALGTLAAIVYASIIQGSAEATTALVGAFGLLIGWYARGRLQEPSHERPVA